MRYLFIFQLLEISERKNSSLLVRQFENFSSHRKLELISIESGFGFWKRRVAFLCHGKMDVKTKKINAIV